MKKFLISKTRRLRSTPFTSRLEKYGVGGYTVYNHMLLPTFFQSVESEYEHLKNHVQLWDVTVQRQIEVNGKDSYKLIQLMTCRDLSKAKINKCYYVPLIDKEGNMVNDPLILKIEENKWRICIADSDVLFFAKGIAGSFNLDVKIFETNISTLAIQGPKSDAVMKKVFGINISKLKFFSYDYFEFKGTKHMISKSGFSKQGGYEIHVENVSDGLDLYDYFFKIGKEFNLKPGTPNHPERIEGGLLSYGSDMDNNDNPLECGFDKYVDLDSDIVFLGKENLIKIKNNGIKRKLMGVKIDIDKIDVSEEIPLFDSGNKVIGQLRSGAFSPKFKKVVGIAMIKRVFCKTSLKFKIKLEEKLVSGEICNLPIN